MTWRKYQDRSKRRAAAKKQLSTLIKKKQQVAIFQSTTAVHGRHCLFLDLSAAAAASCSSQAENKSQAHTELSTPQTQDAGHSFIQLATNIMLQVPSRYVLKEKTVFQSSYTLVGIAPI